MAKDAAGIDSKNSTALVYIRIKRDIRPPIFESLPYRIAIKETQEVNQPFFNLRGRDDDKMGQLKYRIVGTVPAPFFFGVIEETGQIFAKTNLMTDKNFIYNVSIGIFMEVL